MSTMLPGGVPDEHDAGTWTTETLPLSVRRELLERELSKLGFRKATAQGGGSPRDGAGAHHHGEAGSSHPQADADKGSGHGD